MPGTPSSDPPLVDLKITNPVAYFKKWWAKIIGNEGVDFRLHFHPLTAMAIALVIVTVGFGLGDITIRDFLETHNLPLS